MCNSNDIQNNRETGDYIITEKSIQVYQKCTKLFYYISHGEMNLSIENYADPDTGNLARQAIMLFRSRFPEGEAVPATLPLNEAVKRTHELIRKRSIIFNAVLASDNVFGSIDVLLPVENQKWDMYTLKCALAIKNSHFFDSSYALSLAQKNRLRIRSCKSVSINPGYQREKEIDVYKLFKIIDVNNEAGRCSGWVSKTIKEMKQVLARENPPRAEIGAKCYKRFDCPMIEKCWKHIPERSVYLLTGSDRWALSKQLLNSGYSQLKDIPDSIELNDKQKIQVETEKKFKPYIDTLELQKFLAGIKYPLYFIDFEAMINMVVPVYENTHPFQQIPFQFSLHILTSRESEPEHHFYIAKGDKDPRYEIIPLLMKYLGNSGSIIAYNTDFEKKIFRELTSLDERFLDWYTANSGRFVDLMQPFKAFHYYHPLQDGKISLKKVLPVLTGISYSGLDIMDAVTAAEEYMRITFGNVSEEEKEKSIKYLYNYCMQDSLALYKIIQAMSDIVIKENISK